MSQIQRSKSSPFATEWRAAFGETPPLGYELREDYQERWTRFHALPESKRYAENPAEQAEILRRANALLLKCFDLNCEIWVVLVRYEPTPGIQQLSVQGTHFDHALDWLDPRQEPQDQSPCEFWARRDRCVSGAFDALFTATAEEEERVLFFERGSQTVLAPYDGGFDIIAPRPNRVPQLEQWFRAWMSDREDRL